MLKRRNIPLVLVSSKTLAELAEYRAALELHHPVVSENGAMIDIPAGYFRGTTSMSAPTVTRAALQAAYKDVKLAGAYNCEAFYELGLAGIMRETGLSEQQARRANDRQASEPILWPDSDAHREQFEQSMQARGFRCIKGGRFLHLMGNSSKEQAVRQLLAAYARKFPDSDLKSVSVGDAPNDLGMLSSTDIAVIIPGKHAYRMTLSATNRVLRPTLPGPGGWNEAVLTLLEEFPDTRSAQQDYGV